MRKAINQQHFNRKNFCAPFSFHSFFRLLAMGIFQSSAVASAASLPLSRGKSCNPTTPDVDGFAA